MQNSDRTESRIALVRHGRSSHVHAGWIDAEGFQAWRAAHEAAEIRDDERVPADLEQMAAGAGLVVSGDAARAVASARLLANGIDIVVSPLLCELALAGPALGRLQLPLAARGARRRRADSPADDWPAVSFRSRSLQHRRRGPGGSDTKRNVPNLPDPRLDSRATP